MLVNFVLIKVKWCKCVGWSVDDSDLVFKDDDPKDNDDNYDYMIMMMMVMGVDDFRRGWSGDDDDNDVDWDH